MNKVITPGKEGFEISKRHRHKLNSFLRTYYDRTSTDFVKIFLLSRELPFGREEDNVDLLAQQMYSCMAKKAKQKKTLLTAKQRSILVRENMAHEEKLRVLHAAWRKAKLLNWLYNRMPRDPALAEEQLSRLKEKYGGVEFQCAGERKSFGQIVGDLDAEKVLSLKGEKPPAHEAGAGIVKLAFPDQEMQVLKLMQLQLLREYHERFPLKLIGEMEKEATKEMHQLEKKPPMPLILKDEEPEQKQKKPLPKAKLTEEMIDALKNTRRVIVYPYSFKPTHDGNTSADYLSENGFDVIAVNDRGGFYNDTGIYTKLSDVPEASGQMIIAFRRKHHDERVVEEAGRIGARYVWLNREMDEGAKEKARELGIIVLEGMQVTEAHEQAKAFLEEARE